MKSRPLAGAGERRALSSLPRRPFALGPRLLACLLCLRYMFLDGSSAFFYGCFYGPYVLSVLPIFAGLLTPGRRGRVGAF